MAFYNKLKAGVVCLFCLLSPMTYAVDEAPITQEQVEAWNKEGLERFGAGDMIEAIGLLGKAAKEGHAEALAMLGYIYHQGSESEIALPLFEQAVAKGSAFAMNELSVFYAQGIVVKKDPVKSIELIQQAADSDYLPAIVALAAAHENGRAPLSVNNELALKLFTKAADMFSLFARERLVKAHQFGELGLTADPIKAQELKLYYKEKTQIQFDETNKKYAEKLAAEKAEAAAKAADADAKVKSDKAANNE